MTDTKDTLDMLKRAIAIFDSDPEGESEYELRDEMLPALYIVHDYETQGNRPIGTVNCGSVRLNDTPASLYRALFLFKPKRVSFKDMYKGELLTLVSPDYSLVASIEFFKYELGIYFSAASEYIAGRSHGVIAGAPESDNGISYKGELPQAWFGFLVKILDRKWMVYGGNDFEV